MPDFTGFGFQFIVHRFLPEGLMSRRRKPRSVIHFTDPAQPDGLCHLIGQYLDWLAVRNFSPASVRVRREHLGWFLLWCAERGLQFPTDISRPILDRYQRHIAHHRKSNGRPLSFGSQRSRLESVKGFFRWLVRDNHLVSNPASELELPLPERRLPEVLTPREAEAVLAQPRLASPVGLRDRAILETLYSTGIRRLELISLKLYDLDSRLGVARVRQGKGKKDRVVPIGERALAWIDRYLAHARPHLVVVGDDHTLFLTTLGEPLLPDCLTALVRTYVKASGIAKPGACHLFRHTCATAMLENGADVRLIQQLLGHSCLSSTETYTHVSIRLLKAVHTATHPARLERPAAADPTPDLDFDTLLSFLAGDDSSDSPERSNQPTPQP